MGLLNVKIDEAGYPGSEGTIRDVGFSVSEGEQIGLIGPNGAGKSTTIKAVWGLLQEVRGHIDWESQDARYAYVPERHVFYSELTLWEHLSLAAAAFSLEQAGFEKRVDELLRVFSMLDGKHHLVG